MFTVQEKLIAIRYRDLSIFSTSLCKKGPIDFEVISSNIKVQTISSA